MATGRDYSVQWAFSKKKQSAYGTELLDGDLTLAYPFKGPDVVEENIEWLTDDDEFGKGHEFTTRQDEHVRDVKLARNFGLTSFTAGWGLSFAMGSVASAQQEATSAYKHTFKFSDPDTVQGQNPVTTIVELDAAGNKIKVRDLAVNDLKFSGKMKERVQMALNLVGSGHAEASAISMPALTAGFFLSMTGGKLELGPSGALVDESDRFRSFEFGILNNLMADDGYYPGCGLYRGRCRFGRRAATLSLVIAAEGAVERNHIQANDELKAVLTFEGATIEGAYKHSMIITMEKLKYKAIPRSFEDGLQIYTLECQPIYYATDTGPCKVEVINTDTWYLAEA